MPSNLQRFEAIARALAKMPQREPATQPAIETATLHPFDARNIHPGLPIKVRELFDDGHYAEATFEAFKFLDKTVERHSGINETGKDLMMRAFKEDAPKIKLTPLGTASEKNEQEGYKFIFAGGVVAIRNPRGHEHSVVDNLDLCLDHLSFVSMLLRRLEQSGYK
jgi:uncharacterized protein (TIGR02391 family)